MIETWVIALIVTVAVGTVAGFLSGFFGIGGGVILVPAFLWLFGWADPAAGATVKEAIGTSLFLVIPSGLGAARKQIALGNLDPRACARWAVFVVIGACCGIFLSAVSHPAVLKTIFMGYILLCVIVMLALKSDSKKDKGNGSLGRRSQAFGGTVIGALSVLLGAGGGTFVIPYYRLHGCSLHKAIGMSSVTTVLVGVVGAIGMVVTGWGEPGRLPYSLGYVSVIVAILVSPLMFLMSRHGVAVAQRLSLSWLKALYVIFLMLLFGYLVWRTYGV